ncbi:hypothetical protein [Chitinibacter tainanensis]|uniref:hypothetical protein n=1 Tax=Chitinibacter tainanensis TaxID=230667 RepID=UPI000403282B|nr:hypothetical protein [Chitinibacter tainanensis]
MVASTSPFLLLLEVGIVDPTTYQLVETMRLVSNDEDIAYRGNVYVAADFDLGLKHVANGLPEITLNIIDTSRAVQGRMQSYGGGVGFPVTVMIINAGDLNSPPDQQEFFEIIGASSKDYVATFTLGAENPLTMRFPRRLQRKDYCSWRYKSADCGYTGSMPSCDYTLQGPNGCAAHGNSINFGGCPGIIGTGVRYG